jgi:hypothetical protein
MDGDLQDRPEVIPDLYKKAQEGFDIVFVSRQNRPEKIYYRIAQKFFYWILKTLSGINFDSRQANFSIISKKVVEAFNNFPENARFCHIIPIIAIIAKRPKIYLNYCLVRYTIFYILDQIPILISFNFRVSISLADFPFN